MMRRIFSCIFAMMIFFRVGYAADLVIGGGDQADIAVEADTGQLPAEDLTGEELSIDEPVFDKGPYPVYLVEEPVLEDKAATPMVISDSAYFGPISSSVYEYFRDISATGIPWNADYVFYRVDQYNYRLIYSENLTLNNGIFTGSNVHVINYYSYSYNDQNKITRYDELSFTLDDPGAFVYTNLGSGYPELYSGVSDLEFKALFVLVGVCCLYVFVSRCFGR